jgi:hypothetical protein
VTANNAEVQVSSLPKDNFISSGLLSFISACLADVKKLWNNITAFAAGVAQSA